MQKKGLFLNVFYYREWLNNILQACVLQQVLHCEYWNLKYAESDQALKWDLECNGILYMCVYVLLLLCSLSYVSVRISVSNVFSMNINTVVSHDVCAGLLFVAHAVLYIAEHIIFHMHSSSSWSIPAWHWQTLAWSWTSCKLVSIFFYSS